MTDFCVCFEGVQFWQVEKMTKCVFVNKCDKNSWNVKNQEMGETVIQGKLRSMDFCRTHPGKSQRIISAAWPTIFLFLKFPFNFLWRKNIKSNSDREKLQLTNGILQTESTFKKIDNFSVQILWLLSKIKTNFIIWRELPPFRNWQIFRDDFSSTLKIQNKHLKIWLLGNWFSAKFKFGK